MGIKEEAVNLAAVIAGLKPKDEMTLVILPQFENCQEDVRKAVEFELRSNGEQAHVELIGHLSLRASTYS